jgi:hypothetical protein
VCKATDRSAYHELSITSQRNETIKINYSKGAVQIMKANINNKLYEVKIMNSNYNDHAVEVKILEGTFSGKNTIVEKSDLVTAKYTVKAECSKYQSEDEYERSLTTSNYYRNLDFDLSITSEDEETANYIFDKITNYMESELKEYGFEFARCTGFGQIEDNLYLDTASVNYTHGLMTETKKAIMTVYKEAKKSLR